MASYPPLWHILRLIRTENVGPVTFYHLVKRFGSAEEALKRLPDFMHASRRTTPFFLPTWDKVAQEVHDHEAFGASFLLYTDEDYPQALKTLSDAPPVLSFKGDRGLLKKPCFAVVGARNASLVGKKITQECVDYLGKSGEIIVSGLARGIDTTAHVQALATGTVAVLAGGLNVIYPQENEKLYQTIGEKGLLISESPFACEPHPTLFQRRNRLISGLSWGVLVVEAAEKSGSLITAKYANDQGREVFVVPGSPMDSRYHGSNSLIQQGATLIQKPAEIRKSLFKQPMQTDWQEEECSYTASCLAWDETLCDSLREQVLQALSPTPISLDFLLHHLGAPVHLVQGALIELELMGLIHRPSGNGIAKLVS